MARGAQRAARLPAEARRRELLDAALDVISEEGFGAVSVEAVARRAGVTRPVVYDLFGDLEGLLLALVDREEMSALRPLLEIVGGEPGDVDPEQYLADAVERFLAAVRESPRTWRLLLMPPRGGSEDLHARLVRGRRLIATRISELLDWGVERRGGPRGLDHPLLARLIVAAAEDAARLMLLHPRTFPQRRLVALVREGLPLVPVVSPRGGPPELAFSVPERRRPPEQPPPGKRLPRGERREQLLSVALSLLAAEGFEALTIDSVARGAGVNRTVVYRSFANRGLLLVAVLRRLDARVQETLDDLLPSDPEGDPAELLGAVLVGLIEAALREPDTWRVALMRPETAPIALQKVVNHRRAALAKQLRPLVDWGVGALGAPAGAVDTELLARLLLSMGEEQARLALDDPEFTPARIAAGTAAILSALPLPARPPAR